MNVAYFTTPSTTGSRIKPSNVKNVVKAVIWGMIRESGDRGTFVLTFITNLVLFLASISMMLEATGCRDKEVRRILWEVLTGKYANLMGEGDDGAQAFKQAFIDLFGGPAQYGKLWCEGYKEFGFKIEPQGPTLPSRNACRRRRAEWNSVRRYLCAWMSTPSSFQSLRNCQIH